MPIKKRLQILEKNSHLSKKEIGFLRKNCALGLETADMMIENVVGTTQFPMGIATNFIINGKDYLIPMSIEEPSVVAAASNAAKISRGSGGFISSSDLPVMIGQIQITGLNRIKCIKAKLKIQKEKEFLKEKANKNDSLLIKLGGGIKDIETRIVKSKSHMLIVHLIVDVRDAMGANAVNTMCEKIAPHLEKLCGGEIRLRIISNLAIKRMVRVKSVWTKKKLGEKVIDGIIDAYNFAEVDQYRCTTHNKGIMNGVDAVAIATGNDFRAIEAGAHSYASISGKYKPLTKYYKNKKGDLIGALEMPLAVGLVGGATKTHPIAQVSIKILDVKTSQELAEVMGCVGLANNFAALRAMVVEGIQHGHMKLHSKNIAVMAGAKGSLIQKVSERLSKEKDFTLTSAKEILKRLRKK